MRKLSIIIPIGPGRDGEAALRSLAESAIVGQEVIVVLDRGLPHPSVNKLADLVSVRVIESPVIGACAARNLGFEQANNSYCWFLDDDDAVVSDALTLIDNAISEAPSNSAWSFSAISKHTGKSFGCRAGKSTVSHWDLRRRNILGGCSSMVVGAPAFRAVGGFDQAFESMQDWDLYLRIAGLHSILQVPEPLVIYDDTGANRISTDPRKKRSGLVRLLAKHRAHFESRTVALHQTRILFYDCLLGERSWRTLLVAPHKMAGVYYFASLLRRSNKMRGSTPRGGQL